MIKQKDVSLVTTSTSASFVKSHDLTNLLSGLKLSDDEFITKCSVFLNDKVTIPKHSCVLIETHLDIDRTNQLL